MRELILALILVGSMIVLAPQVSARECPNVSPFVTVCVGTPTTVGSSLVCRVDSLFGMVHQLVPCEVTLLP